METTTVLREDPRTAHSAKATTSEAAPAAATADLDVTDIDAAVPTSELGADDPQEIRAILDDIALKGSALDVEGLLAHYADDIATFDCPPPLMVQGKEPLRESWQRDVVDMFQQPISYRYDDVHVYTSASGDLAVARSLMRFVGRTKDGSDMTATLRCTQVFERRDGQWLIVHDHVSAPIGSDGKGLMDLKP